MIVAENKRDVEQGGMGKTVQAKIKASRKLFSFFADGVYSNKPVAILRELVANAIDSHVMAGRPNVPVEVVLPTVFDPTFTVRDFGTGMSEDFLFNNYLVYAEGSTKDGSNEAIGGFGIGKAAVFSYTDQFTLVSIQDGVKGIYSVFVGDDGIPAISQVGVTTTDDHNGVEISFPVNVADIDTFHQAAQTALSYFTPLPDVSNGTIHAPDYTFVGTNWRLRNEAGEIGVILGGVRYPVQKDNLDYALRADTKLAPLLDYGIDLIMPIGSVGVALSREALSYNAQTSASIKKALLAIFDDVKATFGTMFDNEPTLWSAARKLYRETGAGNRYGRGTARQQLLAANAVYKGNTLRTDIAVPKHGDYKVWVIQAKEGWGRSRSVKTPEWLVPSDWRMVTPGNVNTVIVDDLAPTPKSKISARIAEFLASADRTKQIIMLRPTKSLTDLNKAPTSKQIDTILDLIGNPEVTLLSTIDPPVTVKQAKATNVRPRVRMFTWDGKKAEYDFTGVSERNLKPGERKSVVEVPYAIQPASGTMVVMDNFELPDGFKAKMDTHVVSYGELVFVNRTDKDKLDQFVEFDTLFDQRLKAALAALPKDIEQQIAVFDNAELHPNMKQFVDLEADGMRALWDQMTPKQLKTPFGRLLTIYRDYYKPMYLDGSNYKFKAYLKPSLPAKLDIKSLLNDYRFANEETQLVLSLFKPQYGRVQLGPLHVALLLKTL